MNGVCRQPARSGEEIGFGLAADAGDVEVDPKIADRVTHEEGRSWGSSSGDKAGAPATTIQGGAA
jgi:hypothetical protein